MSDDTDDLIDALNPWQATRNRGGWSGGYIEWVERGIAHLSVVFSWELSRAYERAVWHRAMGRRVRAGGPAVDLQPDYLADVAECSLHIPAVRRHNPRACFTTRGCIRKCPFCAVPIIEGDFRELDHIKLGPIVCDNNFLAASRRHFNFVVDGLKVFKGVDFNQGLDARLLTKYHAERLAELDLRCLRLAWDETRNEQRFLRAFGLLRAAGIPASMIRVYVLLGFNDTPEDALYRLETIRELGAWPNPARYQPLDAAQKNSYVGEHWTDAELKRYMRYWYNLRITGSIPFEEFAHRGREPDKIDTRQGRFVL